MVSVYRLLADAVVISRVTFGHLICMCGFKSIALQKSLHITNTFHFYDKQSLCKSYLTILLQFAKLISIDYNGSNGPAVHCIFCERKRLVFKSHLCLAATGTLLNLDINVFAF